MTLKDKVAGPMAIHCMKVCLDWHDSLGVESTQGMILGGLVWGFGKTGSRKNCTVLVETVFFQIGCFSNRSR